jgi:hypothetical protein
LANRHLAETMPRLSVDWGLSSKHFIFFVTYKWANKARVFVTGMPYKLSIMFARNAGAYLEGAPNYGRLRLTHKA